MVGMRKIGLANPGPGGTMDRFSGKPVHAHPSHRQQELLLLVHAPLVAMTAFGIPFEERQHWLDTPEFAAQVSPLSPVAKVPVLEDGDLRIWDSLAIGEYLAERFPELALWPRDVAKRALARCLCASMHSGFAALREHMVMNIEADLPGRAFNPAVQRDIEQILLMWQGALQASGGPFLFGAFGLVDAFYAPVCMRFLTYRPTLPDWAWAYVQAVADHPAVAKWIEQARAERVYLLADEPYRTPAQAGY